jgi:hypothetical protein
MKPQSEANGGRDLHRLPLTLRADIGRRLVFSLIPSSSNFLARGQRLGRSFDLGVRMEYDRVHILRTV